MTKIQRSQRHELILREVRTEAAIRVSELARQLGVAGETIRRDLAELAAAGLINRTYGGASISLRSNEPVIAERGLEQIEERTRIGRLTATIVADGQTVMIDGGSTTQAVARYLAELRTDLTVITNSITIAALTGANASFRVILCPGTYDLREGSVLGEDTIEYASRYNIDVAILGASGATNNGPCDANSAAAAFKRVMLRQAEMSILVVDATKFGRRSVEQICGWTEIDHIVTDLAPESDVAASLASAGTTIHVAGGWTITRSLSA